MNVIKKVSIIIPSRNEEKFIGKCLNSIVTQDYPKENLEVLVVDGMSEDKTKEIVKDYSQKYSFIKLLDNPNKITPFAMNIGIKNSKGDIIMKIDAHSVYQKDYISKCLENLQKYKADNVGGILKTLPAKNTLIAKAIALSLSSFFGAGNSYFRTGLKEAKEADTVAFGCYKREVFDKIGLYNENLARSQDMELNVRLKKAGGKIMLCPDIAAIYYPKDNLKDFFWHNFQDGFWAVYPLKFVKIPFSIRHYIPLIFASALFFSFILSFFSEFFRVLFWLIIYIYFLVNAYFSYKISKREREAKFLFLLPLVFSLRHFGYGLGSLWGFAKIIF